MALDWNFRSRLGASNPGWGSSESDFFFHSNFGLTTRATIYRSLKKSLLRGPQKVPESTRKSRKIPRVLGVNKRGRPSKWPPECLPSKFADFECAFSL